MATINLQVNNNNGDARNVGPTFQSCGFGVCPPVLRAGRSAQAAYNETAGLRFTNVTIPQRAVIDTATLVFTANISKSTAGVRTTIQAHEVDNPDDFSGDTSSSFLARFQTQTASVNWDDIPAWTIDTEYTSPDIKTVIQVIVDRDGWVSGNAFVLAWHDMLGRSNLGVYRGTYPHNVSNAKAVKLNVTFTVLDSPTVTTQECTSTRANESTGHGTVTDWGDAFVTQLGHCWATSASPTTADSKTENGAAPQLGQFQSAITGLIANTLYYVRAYATNLYGTSYGDDVTITTSSTISGRDIGVRGTNLVWFDEDGVERKARGTLVTGDSDILKYLYM